jgi:4-diphosphocytidyl-2-C-methyl-D-erythritol kinase
MIVRLVAGGVEVLAPAKLNLFLEVLGRRPDGYHNIESVMVAVNLHDRLTFAPDATGRITLSCDDPSLPTGSENLVVKAAERLKRSRNCPSGALIRLEKQIPAQAGLGGGSSDAAATLVGLDLLWNLQTPPDQLDELAGEIGSDVAFFLHAPAALCRGRGERVEPLPLPHPFYFVLVCPPSGLQTAEVYRHLIPPEQPLPAQPVLEALSLGDPAALGRSVFNRLQTVAEGIRPALAQVREALEAQRPLVSGHLLSGSGTAYFGLCPNLDAARCAARALEKPGLGSVRVVNCGP